MELFSIRIQRTFQLVSTGVQNTLAMGKTQASEKGYAQD